MYVYIYEVRGTFFVAGKDKSRRVKRLLPAENDALLHSPYTIPCVRLAGKLPPFGRDTFGRSCLIFHFNPLTRTKQKVLKN